MKSLSITALVSVVLIAAGLLVVYKTPAPEAGPASAVLAVDMSAMPGVTAESGPEPGDAPLADAAGAPPDAEIAGETEQDNAAEPQTSFAAPPREGETGSAGEGDSGERQKTDGRLSPWDAGPGPNDGFERNAAADRGPRRFQEDWSSNRGQRLQDRGGPSEADAPAAPPPPYLPDRGAAPPASSPFDLYETARRPPDNFNAPPSQAQPDAPDPNRGGSESAGNEPASPAQQPPEAEAAAPAPAPDSVTAATPDAWRPQPPEPSAAPPAAPESTPKPAAAPIPKPPLPAKRANAQPAIPRDRSSSVTPPPSILRTSGAEQRNAAETAIAPFGPALAQQARAATRPAAPRIAIIVRDLGLNERDTHSAITNLRPEITLAFSPYGRDAKGWALKAKETGHETFAGVPMEPADLPAADAAPNMLLASLSPEENLKRFDWALEQVADYDGLINIMGGKLSQTPGAIRPLMEAMKAKGLAYVDDGAAAHPFAILLAAQLHLRYRIADSRIDADPSASAIQRELRSLEAIALEKGSAVGVASANAETLRQIILWCGGLPSKNIALVPAASLIEPADLR